MSIFTEMVSADISDKAAAMNTNKMNNVKVKINTPAPTQEITVIFEPVYSQLPGTVMTAPSPLATEV